MQLRETATKAWQEQGYEDTSDRYSDDDEDEVEESPGGEDSVARQATIPQITTLEPPGSSVIERTIAFSVSQADEFRSVDGDDEEDGGIEKRMKDHFPDDPTLSHFSRRYVHQAFDPTAIRDGGPSQPLARYGSLLLSRHPLSNAMPSLRRLAFSRDAYHYNRGLDHNTYYDNGEGANHLVAWQMMFEFTHRWRMQRLAKGCFEDYSGLGWVFVGQSQVRREMVR
ncbi:MAG: hypothetical protein LQ350_007449 [Teloschistes chrysophthalmus]|nr:MAG: hypothetical protein LQ350_007449 [Niorma chrysophthalma]